jgi:hypothetical protein
MLPYWLLICALYLGLVWWLAREVSEEQYPLLRQLHWGISVLCLLALLVPVLTLWDWTFRSPTFLCLLLLVSGVLAGIRGWLRLARQPAPVTAQAVLIGLIAPVLLAASLEAPPVSIAYADSNYTVTVTEHVGWMDENARYPEVEFYSTRLLLFEKNLGHVSLSQSQLQGSTPQMKEWWQGVSSLTFAADSNRGVAWRDGMASRFSVNPPYRPLGEAVPTRPPETPVVPPIDNKVYTYVEKMPSVAGQQGVASIKALLERQLVTLPKARRVRVRLVVTRQGIVQQVQLVQGLNASADSAVLVAVRQLPRLAPGMQNGQPMNVCIDLVLDVGKK